VYFDSQANGAILDQVGSNHFVGVGPHFGVEVRRALEFAPGLAVFGRLDGAVVIGEASQHFHESVLLADGTTIPGDTRISNSRSVPVLNFQTGVSYTPPAAAPWFRFSFGYEIDQWWGLGNVHDSRADLTVQGLFFRSEFRY
jgi:hypothetical protein